MGRLIQTGIKDISHCAVFFAFCTSYGSRRQRDNEAQGVRANSLAGASLALQDGWAVNNNVATLGLIDEFNIGAVYGTRFFLPEAGLGSIALAAPLAGGSIGIIGHNYGYGGFSQNRIGLGYGRKLSDFFSLVLQLDYLPMIMMCSTVLVFQHITAEEAELT